MLRIMLKSKIHRVKVTEANLYYEGSISIDALLMEKADILPGEKVEVLNLNNGLRLETYAIKAKPGSGIICLNGPAARGACAGDLVIVVSYVCIEDAEAKKIKPKIVKVDGRNRAIKN
ncbi:MAG: aspartate 1-decarboxylase [Candidatus Omnitrophota bacterium]|nr:aspartate 1-decarboxylase [Candidatus Omnitrophota bacterium]MBU1928836.1 aspartate 1-decarboxylase [Candidatus Omnitrophota bacterium]MBU2034446.1 aspartate 1-decarboxylase [Candidatus Omnitrophota bacterium]MBU2221278.1 aspartate 1-decarboxylase [Candidatus Omnitrophota bacterium]MBU2258306.1 aspartate 1-decarboxylase [Candidatus Omnitrophota bacterium]